MPDTEPIRDNCPERQVMRKAGGEGELYRVLIYLGRSQDRKSFHELSSLTVAKVSVISNEKLYLFVVSLPQKKLFQHEVFHNVKPWP